MTYRESFSSGHGGGHTPAPIRPCDLYSEEIHLLVDRELGEAERQVVEEHLQGCPQCTALASHLERMSSVLKAWDQRENDVEAPVGGLQHKRLEHTVLTRVAESGARRRRDDRLVRVLHLATAAVVILGLGLGVVLGLQASGERAADLTFEISDAPWPLENRVRPPVALDSSPFEDRLTKDDLLAGINERVFPDLAGDPGLVSDDHMRVFTSGDDQNLADLELRLKRLETFSDRIGEPAMYWNGPYRVSVDSRVVPESTYRWMLERGLVQRWHAMSTRTSPTVATPAKRMATPRAAEPSEVLPKAMLRPMPGVTHALRLTNASRLGYVPGMAPMRARAAKSKRVKVKGSASLPPLVEMHAIQDPTPNIPGLISGPLNQPNRAFLDPIDAWGNQKLRFAESQHDAGQIVAFVKNTKKPIFIPAGQFITDGHGDRVVRHPTWLPPSKGETPHIIHCVVVQAMPHVEALGVPQLSPHIVGPSIRALLAAGASQAEIKAAARSIVFALHKHSGAQAFSEMHWSLYRFYKSNIEANVNFATRVRWKQAHGFIATDGQGRLLGFELVRISGASAHELLGRLWLGYVVEAMWRIQSPALRDAFAAPSDGASRVLGRLASHDHAFQVPGIFAGDDPARARVSTLQLESSGVSLHALEVGGRPAIVSGLSAPARDAR